MRASLIKVGLNGQILPKRERFDREKANGDSPHSDTWGETVTTMYLHSNDTGGCIEVALPDMVARPALIVGANQGARQSGPLHHVPGSSTIHLSTPSTEKFIP